MQNVTIKTIKNLKIRYQPIILPNGKVIRKRCARSILDSRRKLERIFLPSDLSQKTLLDIGCAEGFFLREAIGRGARFAQGIDLSPQRVKVNRYLNKLWGYSDRIRVTLGDFRDLKKQYDIVLCLSVIHHLQKTKQGIEFLDPWQMITNRQYRYIYQEHIKTIKKIAALTKDLTIFEYPYTYKGYRTRRKDLDFSLLGKVWMQEGIYRKVEYKGLSQKSRIKDRAVYLAYK